MASERTTSFQLTIRSSSLARYAKFLDRHAVRIIVIVLTLISAASFLHYYANGLGLAYNDARSHLDIGRRVVEGLKPGLAQLGSVWLPLTHLLMVPTVWNDFMWHSGLAGALQSMIAFVATGAVIYLYLKRLHVGLFGRFVGVAVFVLNINILYLQSTAMTELLLLATMTVGAYELLLWFENEKILHLVRSAFWIMLSTLVRYDGWFLLFFATAMIVAYLWWRNGYARAEGTFVLFCTLGGFGVFLWLLWNQLIFKDALFFAFGPYSAHSQQTQLDAAGVLATKGNLLLSIKHYFYALAYNSGMFTLLLGIIGAMTMWASKRLAPRVRYATLTLTAPFFFNVLALYLGHSVLFIAGLSGETWFNVRYGVMLMPSIAICIGYLVDRARSLQMPLVALLAFTTFFSFMSVDAVTIDDATVGSSQKNVTEVSGWLYTHARDKEGFVLISAASHDAIIFSSGLPMKKFIHEGTGAYWKSATANPDRWARWIIMRTYSDDDLTYRLVKDTPGLEYYDLVGHFPFADIYELKDEFLSDLETKPVFGRQK